MRKQNFFLLFLQIGIISCGISISISQLFLFLTFLIFWLIPEKRNPKLSALFWGGIGIFGIYVISLLVNWSFENFQAFFSKQSEFKDILLLSAFLVTHNLSQKEQAQVKKAFSILILVLMITGFVSIFSHVRLSVLLNEMFREVKHWRYTHGYGEIFGISINLPIGLMNTHLTFGGLLMLFAPFIFFRTLQSFQQKESVRKKFLLTAGLLFFVIVFILNNARSAMFGTLFAVLFGVYDYFINKRAIELQKFLKYTLALVLGIVFIFAILLSIETTSKTVRHLIGSEKHTDSGRTFIWDSTYPIIKENFWFGVGVGNYNKAIEKTRLERSNQNPELAYFYEVTQRGHA
ncbi:MAG: O-antigen ligase family protein, partial [Leptospiraceae bacterium]|nr:O-antigen ligase family protein [Leptospiraceae bacterium]